MNGTVMAGVMKQLYRDFLQAVDSDRLMKHTEELYRLELGQTFKDYHNAARYVHELMVKEGIPNAELITYPADGKTTYNDVCMPLAWDAEVGRLTLLNAPETFISGLNGAKQAGKVVVADYQVHPYHLIKGSVATPSGGQIVRIITEQQFLAGEDPRGALVMLEPFSLPRGNVLVAILDQGGLGLITDRVGGRYDHPDSFAWVNAGTEGAAWHVMADDRPFISFSVSPKTGDLIRNSANRLQLKALVECNGRRYVGKLPAITALIPGRRKEEAWIYAHMYEPMSDDDANGVVAGIETARQIMRRGTPEFSVRLVFAMELYGYMAYIASRGSCLRDEVIGGCNYDALGAAKGVALMCYSAARGTPFYGNYLLEQLVGELKDEPGMFPCQLKGSAYFDDISFSDPTIGIPAVWPLGRVGDCHHCSVETMDFIDRETFLRGTAFNAAYIYALANPSEKYLDAAAGIALGHLTQTHKLVKEAPFGSDAERLSYAHEIEQRHLGDFKRFVDAQKVDAALKVLEAEYAQLARGLSKDLKSSAPWRDYAARIVMKRAATGFPHNLVKVPRAKRAPDLLPDGVIYGHMANILANMDGKKDLATLVREAEYERNSPLPENRIKKHVSAVNFLADYGYLEIVSRPELTEGDIIASLRSLGVKAGDLLLVHSSTSNCGYVKGGARTVINAIKEVLGKKGTALFPAFTTPYLLLGGLNRRWVYRPFDASDLSQISTGNVPRTLLEEFPGTLRSRHITHSWTGFGPLAAECLNAHGAFDPPGSANSPMGKALEHGGQVLHFGSSMATTTFLHFLEDHCDMPFLDTAVCRLKALDGSFKTVTIEKHFTGHRDFYCGFKAESCKFFSRAKAAGLRINSGRLGLGELRLMETKELFDIGKELLRADPRILLCDNPECVFCGKNYKSNEEKLNA